MKILCVIYGFYDPYFKNVRLSQISSGLYLKIFKINVQIPIAVFLFYSFAANFLINLLAQCHIYFNRKGYNVISSFKLH